MVVCYADDRRVYDFVDPHARVIPIAVRSHAVIESGWTFAPRPVSGSHFVAPDTRVDIVVRIDGAARAQAILFGPDMKPTSPRFDAGARYLGVRLRPTVGASLFGTRATVLMGRGVPVATWRAQDPEEVLARIYDLVESLSARDRAPAPSWLRDVVCFAEAHATISVASLARASGLGTRSLSRAFARWVGPSPKQTLRLFRARAATRALSSGTAAAQVAVDLGYADQAHLTRELRGLFGVTPGAIRRHPGLSDLFNPGAVSSLTVKT